MANQNDFWSWIMTDQAKTALAGAAGGIVRWVTLRERWQDGVAAREIASGRWQVLVLQERGGQLACLAKPQQRNR